MLHVYWGYFLCQGIIAALALGILIASIYQIHLGQRIHAAGEDLVRVTLVVDCWLWIVGCGLLVVDCVNELVLPQCVVDSFV